MLNELFIASSCSLFNLSRERILPDSLLLKHINMSNLIKYHFKLFFARESRKHKKGSSMRKKKVEKKAKKYFPAIVSS